jgi:hypothetical protein
MDRGLQNVQKQRHSAGVSGCGGEVNHLAVEWSRDDVGLRSWRDDAQELLRPTLACGSNQQLAA